MGDPTTLERAPISINFDRTSPSVPERRRAIVARAIIDWSRYVATTLSVRATGRGRIQMVFDLSDLADSMGVATGWRALAQSARGNSCSCSCAREDHRRPSYLVESDPDGLFGTDEMTPPPVIGE